MESSNNQSINSFVTEVSKSKTRYSRVALTGAQKKDLCQKKLDNPSLTNKYLLPQQRSELKSILAGYNACDIFNCDETGLYWKLEPRKTLAHGPVSGKKIGSLF